MDADFRIFDGKIIHGTLEWSEKASAGITAGREKTLNISGTYYLNWADYSQIGSFNRGKLRYLLVKISGNTENV